MSGGHFDYKDLELTNEIIDQLKRDDYPTEKMEKLVELVGNILHAYDWFKSGDTNEKTFKQEYYQNIQNIKRLLK